MQESKGDGKCCVWCVRGHPGVTIIIRLERQRYLGGLVGHGQAAKINSLDSRLSPRRPRANVNVLQDLSVGVRIRV